MAMPDKISNCNRQGAPGPKNPGNPKLKKTTAFPPVFETKRLQNETAFPLFPIPMD